MLLIHVKTKGTALTGQTNSHVLVPGVIMELLVKTVCTFLQFLLFVCFVILVSFCDEC